MMRSLKDKLRGLACFGANVPLPLKDENRLAVEYREYREILRNCFLSTITACAVFIMGALAMHLVAEMPDRTLAIAALPYLKVAFFLIDGSVLLWILHSWQAMYKFSQIQPKTSPESKK